jgi:lantibiotic modifying enzyme
LAGIGLTSVFFYRKTGDRFFLEKATQCARSIIAMSKEDEHGRYWENVDGAIYYGFCHGGSGIAFFFLKLYEASENEEYLTVGKSFLEYDIANAKDEQTQLVWQYSNKEVTRTPYWRYGSAGVGSTLLRFYQILGDPRYLELSYKVGRYIQKKSSVFPGYIIGMAGMGEFFLDMYIATKDPAFLTDVHWYTRNILLYKLKEKEGIAFPGEELIRIATDFGTGSAGIGYFFDRIVKKNNRLFYDF